MSANTTDTYESETSNYRRTKIVCTLGPASRSYETITELIKAGANVFRLNFSHGSHEEHLETLQRIRKAQKELSMNVAVLQDLSGPKIRITDIKDGFTQVTDRKTIEMVVAGEEPELTTSERIYVQGLDPHEIVEHGHTVYLSDGIIKLKVIAVHGNVVKCEIEKGGRLRAKAGIAFPDSDFELPATTDKDYHDLGWGLKNGVDYVAISFVNNASDIFRLRETTQKAGSDVQIIAKIERRCALENIDEIIDAADGLMVARGDLGLEMPLEQIPFIQKKLIKLSNQQGKPVIVATQMMHSMISAVRPTRAEVSDIAAAVYSGTDAVMLSEETAIGQHPVLAVEYLGRVAQSIEQDMFKEQETSRPRSVDLNTVSDSVAYAACAAARKIKAKAIIACTQSGTAARLVSKYRPTQPIFGASNSERTLRKLALNWGILTITIPPSNSREDENNTAVRELQKSFPLLPRTRVVITGGSKVNQSGSTSVMQIMEL